MTDNSSLFQPYEPGTSHEAPGPQPRLRGHAPKIMRAHLALRIAGKLPKKLRPVERNKIVLDWLDANGYEDYRPSRQALDRYFEARDT